MGHDLCHHARCHTCHQWIQHNVLHLMFEILVQNPIPKLNSLGLCDSLNHFDQSLHISIGLSQTFMRFALKFLQSAKFLSLHPLIICAQLPIELYNCVKHKQNSNHNYSSNRGGRNCSAIPRTIIWCCYINTRGGRSYNVIPKMIVWWYYFVKGNSLPHCDRKVTSD
jgi:hypothetical protein